jgi:hypothetical protein
MFPGNGLECSSGGAWNGFCQLEIRVIFGLTGVLGVENFLQADHLSTCAGSFANLRDASIKILRNVRRTLDLQQRGPHNSSSTHRVMS